MELLIIGLVVSALLLWNPALALLLSGFVILGIKLSRNNGTQKHQPSAFIRTTPLRGVIGNGILDMAITHRKQ